jgi:magnesium transporter
LSAKEIAEELDELNTDDAADIIAELSQSKGRSNFRAG